MSMTPADCRYLCKHDTNGPKQPKRSLLVLVYCRSEGFDGTAAAVYARLKELGHTDETAAALNPSSDAEARSSIYDFQV